MLREITWPLVCCVLGLQSLWINPTQRIPFHIPKPIPTPCQINRICLRIPPRPTVITPKVVVIQPTLFIKVLPRIAQVKRHIRNRRCAQAGAIGRIYKPVLSRRRLFIPKRTKRPLPSHLLVALGQAAWCVQVVGVHGVMPAAVVEGHGHGACGGGQVHVVGAAGAAGPASALLIQ